MTVAWETSRRAWKPVVICSLAMALAALALTWPLAAMGGKAIPGYNWTDEAMFLWNFHMVQRWLWHGDALWHTQAMHGPWGVYFLVHTHAFLYGLMGALLLPITGSTAWGYNLTILWAFWAGGMAMWLLARELRLGPVAAFVAGLVFSFSAHRLGHLAHQNLLSVEAIPLALWGLARLVRCGARRTSARHRGRYIGVVALSFLYTVWIDYYTAIYLIVGLGGAALIHLVATPRRVGRLLLSRRFHGFMHLWFMVTLLGIAPIIWSWWAFGRQLPPDVSGIATLPRYPGIEVSTLLLPPPHTTLGTAIWGADHAQAPRPITIEQEGYLGWAGLMLALVALGGWRLLGRRRYRQVLLVSGCLALVLLLASENPTLGGQPLPLQGPSAWLASVPLLKEARVPGRIMMLAAVPLALLAGLGVAAVAGALRALPRRVALPVGLGLTAMWLGLFASETRRPVPWSWLEGPGCHVPANLLAQLANDPLPGGVLRLPFDAPAISNLLQITHGRPTFTGFMARGHGHVLWQLMGRDLALLPAGSVPDPIQRPNMAERRGALLRRTLEDFHIRYVVVQEFPHSPQIVAYLREHLPEAEVLEERAPSGLLWTAFRIAPRPATFQGGQPAEPPTEVRLRLASSELDVTPSDLYNSINSGHHAGAINRRRGIFAVHLSEAELAAHPRLSIELEGWGLPPRARDGQSEQMQVHFNGTCITAEPITILEGQHRYRVSVPPNVVETGWNMLELRFLHGITPKEVWPDDSTDDVQRAIFVHLLEVVLERTAGSSGQGS